MVTENLSTVSTSNLISDGLKSYSPRGYELPIHNSSDLFAPSFSESSENFVSILGHIATNIEQVPTPSYLESEGVRIDSLDVSQIEARPAQGVPQLKSLTRRHHLLTEETLDLIRRFWAIVLSKASFSELEIQSGGVDVEEDPEERTSQVVLRVYVNASPSQTLAFWDSLDIELSRWFEHLDDRSRQSAMQNIGLRFHWAS